MVYDNDDPYANVGEGVFEGNLNTSTLMASMFEMIGRVNLPGDFRNKIFGSNEVEQRGRFIRAILENNTMTNNGSTLVASAANQSFVLNTKVILSLFKSWKAINVTGTNVNVTITIRKKSDNSIIKTVNNNEDLTNYNINEKQVKIEIKANAACTINNILLELSTKRLDNKSGINILIEQVAGLEQRLKNILLEAHPIGSVYMSNNNTSPATLFGGTWSKIEGRMLIGAGTTYPLGNTGGSATHTLSSNEMPQHSHGIAAHNHTATAANNSHSHTANYASNTTIGGQTSRITGSGADISTSAINSATHTHTITVANNTTGLTTGTAGGTSAHNNMPPWQAVNMWIRTA